MITAEEAREKDLRYMRAEKLLADLIIGETNE